MTDTLDHAGLEALAKKLGPLFTLEVLHNDPFTANIRRESGAEWFAELWKKLNVQPGAHLHRIHYRDRVARTPVLMPTARLT